MSENKLSILNRMFSRSTFRHVIDTGFDETYASVIKRYVQNNEGRSNRELISEIYSKLGNDYRNEYFYKNTLLNKLLLGVHSVNTTTALTEIPIGRAKADFVLINGKAVVYEIKTELDNLDRLKGQINEYYKAFDHVAVVTYPEKLNELQEKLSDLDKPVGIYVLQKNGRLKPVRKPERYVGDINKEIIFKIMRKQEYENIILTKYKQLPVTTQFKYYKTCKKILIELTLDELYPLFLKELKKRTLLVRDEFEKVPYELKFLAYFMELKERDYYNLESFLHRQFGGI